MSGRYILMGCGGHGRSVADAILADEPEADIVFVDANAMPEERIMGFPAVTVMPSWNGAVIPAAGDNGKRREGCRGLDIRTFVSRSAHIGRGAQIGNGCFIACGAHVGPGARIGMGSIVNTNAVVEHDATAGEFCHIAPNATVCGGCKLGDMVLVGAGAVLKPYTTVASGTIIGAGAVVAHDINEPGRYVGSPARKLPSK